MVTRPTANKIHNNNHMEIGQISIDLNPPLGDGRGASVARGWGPAPKAGSP